MSTILTILVNTIPHSCFVYNSLTVAVFKTPMPNPKLWTSSTVGLLANQDSFANGGWWQDQHILEATGEGVEKEEPVAWHGWWNENIVCPAMTAFDHYQRAPGQLGQIKYGTRRCTHGAFNRKRAEKLCKYYQSNGKK